MNNKITNQSLTVLVPLYNEAECLSKLVEKLNDFLDDAPIAATILFINDGSTDDSQRLIESVAALDFRYHYLKLKGNCGLSTAIKAGIDYCNTSLIGYIDADLQTSPRDFLSLLEFVPEYDLVTGIRVNRNDGIIKRVSSKIANAVRQVLINDGIKDTGCPLKIMKAEYAKAIPFFNGAHRFIPALFLMYGGKVKQIPVQHFARFAGKAKYTLGNRLIKPLVDAIAFRWMKSRHIIYHIEKSA